MYAPNPLAKTLGTWLLLMFALVMSSAAWAQRDDGQYQPFQQNSHLHHYLHLRGYDNL